MCRKDQDSRLLCGVLNHYDLTTYIPLPSSTHRTRTCPFMVIDILRSNQPCEDLALNTCSTSLFCSPADGRTEHSSTHLIFNTESVINSSTISVAVFYICQTRLLLCASVGCRCYVISPSSISAPKTNSREPLPALREFRPQRKENVDVALHSKFQHPQPACVIKCLFFCWSSAVYLQNKYCGQV